MLVVRLKVFADFHTGNKKPRRSEVSNNGARGRIRTSDRLVRSQVLYPTELHAHRFVGRIMPPVF